MRGGIGLTPGLPPKTRSQNTCPGHAHSGTPRVRLFPAKILSQEEKMRGFPERKNPALRCTVRTGGNG
jgi:hypothetical protein